LRELNERQILEGARRALELKDQQKNLTLKAVDHRIQEQLTNRVEPFCICELKERVRRNLYSTGLRPAYLQSPPFTIDFINLTISERRSSTNISPTFVGKFAAASCGPGRVWALIVDAAPLTISNDMAATLALIVNELLYSQMRFNIRDRLVMAEPYTWRLASTQTSFQ
jgi:hypothetical protein